MGWKDLSHKESNEAKEGNEAKESNEAWESNGTKRVTDERE